MCNVEITQIKQLLNKSLNQLNKFKFVIKFKQIKVIYKKKLEYVNNTLVQNQANLLFVNNFNI